MKPITECASTYGHYDRGKKQFYCIEHGGLLNPDGVGSEDSQVHCTIVIDDVLAERQRAACYLGVVTR